MRLTPDEIAAIKAATTEIFGPNAVVRLFGSRTDDAARGGDIDLHVEVPSSRDGSAEELESLERLEGRIGPRRVDLALHARGAARAPIDRIALETGVVL